jgi:tRNA(adenine34) deaminase
LTDVARGPTLKDGANVTADDASSVRDEHAHWMRDALRSARLAATHHDVPIGAVVVRDGVAVARGRNRREIDRDPTAHAELVAIRRAARRLGSWRLEGCTLYVTLEPCAMCAGAIVLARMPRLVFGTLDPKAGFVGSLGDLCRDARLNHRLEVVSGVLAEECGKLLVAFFREKRVRGARDQPNDVTP